MSKAEHAWSKLRKVELSPLRQRGRQSARTDLAIEARELMQSPLGANSGIVESFEDLDDIRVSRVFVKTKVAERKIGKKKGHYVTLEVPGLRQRNPDLQERVAEVFAKEFESLLKLPSDASVLVVGLGNSQVTPDSLGPHVIQNLFVTRHLFTYMPEILGDGKGYRVVSAIAPGVLGVTGMETSEIVQGIVDKVRPDAVVVVDALAARSLSRLNSTIQLADSGIQPGAGVGNRRRAITAETLGVPVLAVGIPTVVEAATIALDTMDRVTRTYHELLPGKGTHNILKPWTSEDKGKMVREVLTPLGDNLMVTPKEIDEFMDDMATVVAKGLNVALHPAMTLADAAMLTH
ncbi:MAG: GPR endopeptidase [Alicyclobacillaceae bacterium]|nr:GPR endopeptidase [Alicyclobacillaceae bacterium]